MNLPVSEKNFLERIADGIPGLAGYRGRESRRDTDKRLREHLARRLDRARGRLDEARRGISRRGDLGPLGAVGELDKRLRRGADSLRHASYGYTGLFDQVKLRESELDRIYRFDLGLLDQVEEVERAMAEIGDGGDSGRLDGVAPMVDRLLEQIAQRGEIFEQPKTGGL